jgi:hypothetical protein
MREKQSNPLINNRTDADIPGILHNHLNPGLNHSTTLAARWIDPISCNDFNNNVARATASCGTLFTKSPGDRDIFLLNAIQTRHGDYGDTLTASSGIAGFAPIGSVPASQGDGLGDDNNSNEVIGSRGISHSDRGREGGRTRAVTCDFTHARVYPRRISGSACLIRFRAADVRP